MIRQTCLVGSALALIVLAWPTVALAGDYDELGNFERREVDAVLAQKGLAVHPEPTGKEIGRIVVVNREVFVDRDGGFLQWFNIFHWTSREYVIEREVLMRPGATWDQDLVDESVRRIRDPILSNVVAILPVETDDPGVVDLLVVTRDVWSLRLNTDFQLQQSQLTSLSIGLAENNFLGLRKKLSVVFSMDQGAFAITPRWADGNIAGTRMTLAASGSALFSRATGAPEGSASSLTLAYPLWSLSQNWGGSVSFSHWHGIKRFFRGATLLQYQVPETEELFPARHRLTTMAAAASATYMFGTGLKKQFSFGWQFSQTKASLSPDFEGDDFARKSFEDAVFPRQELSTGPFVQWRIFEPRYRTYRNLQTFELREDLQMGPEFSYRIGQALEVFGSDANFTSLSTSFQYVFEPMRDAYVKLDTAWSARVEGGEVFDHAVGVGIWAASPTLGKALRVIARIGLDAYYEDRGNRDPLSLGGENGLRGHEVSALRGSKRLRANLELRSLAFRLWFFRIGGVVFYDVGDTAEEIAELQPTQDVGAGLRILIPQINPFVLRVDWAFATEGPTAGFPGRVSAGFFQAF